MKQNYLARLLCAALLPGTAIPAAAFTPAAPGNLKADVNGIIADLSWDWGNAGEPTLAESFEADAFAAPWSVKNTYSFGTSAGTGKYSASRTTKARLSPTTASVPH